MTGSPAQARRLGVAFISYHFGQRRTGKGGERKEEEEEWEVEGGEAKRKGEEWK